MKPAAFQYHDPATVNDALSLLAALGDDAKIVAGGQSLIPLMNMRLAQPANLVDLRRLRELEYIRDEGDFLAIGALTRHRLLETSPLVRAACPVLAAAAGLVGHFQIRERGTLGGSLAHADPVAELPLVATLLDAKMTIRSLGGERTVTPPEFFFSVFMTALAPHELITEVRIRKLRPCEGWAVQEFARRPGDFALVSTAVVVELRDGVVESARVALGGVGLTAQVMESAAAVLVGERPTEERFRQIGEQVSTEIDPDSDLHASAQDRRDIARTLVVRALSEAVARTESTQGNTGSGKGERGVQS